MKPTFSQSVACAAAFLGLLTSLQAQSAEPSDARKPPGFVGLRIKADSGWPAVGAVVEDSPASKAGLLGGERILAINGQSTQHRPVAESAKRLAGAAGEPLTLTLLRPDSPSSQPFEVTLVRMPFRRNARFLTGGMPASKADWTRPPTKEAGPVEWHGSNVASRVLPYPDFISLVLRLPIAHAAALGQGVRLGVIQFQEAANAQTLIENIAPRAEVETHRCATNGPSTSNLVSGIVNARWRVALIAEPGAWPMSSLVELAEQLLEQNVLVVVPSDLSEEKTAIATINKLAAAGALTVGRVDRQSKLFPSLEGRSEELPFNRRIVEIHTDVFSAIGLDTSNPPVTSAATAAGVAALVLEKWPHLSARDLRQRVVRGSRPAWQMLKTDAPMQDMPFTVDPVTTELKPKNEKAVFRFRVLDAASALGVDTELPWFLNMLNCRKAWEITRGRGVRVLVTDQGFHVKHPALASHIESTQNFGPRTFSTPDQNFHGTDMSRILLAVAPEARLVPVLCSGQDRDEMARNIAKSFRYAVELKADVVSASWAGWFNSDSNLLSAVRGAVDRGIVVSWFHYPNAYPGLLRSSFTYAGGWDSEPRLGFPDRFCTDPPGFHPVEIEAGLSATAPQAAGIAALVKSVNPKLSPQEIEQLIFQNGTAIRGGILIPDAWKTVLAAKAAHR